MTEAAHLSSGKGGFKRRMYEQEPHAHSKYTKYSSELQLKIINQSPR
jgi:hypothetical protein